MKQFVLGSAFLMFISSLPSGASNDHAISVAPSKIEPQKVAFLQSFGDTLPPIGYVNFCREHQADCLPEAKFADRVQLTGAKFRELEQVNDQINTSIQPATDIDLYGKVEYWTYPTHNKGDFVLDNKRREILRFADTPYTYIKRQSERNPLVWISLLPPDSVPQTAVSASSSH